MNRRRSPFFSYKSSESDTYWMWGSSNESWKTEERGNHRIPAIAIAIMPPHCISHIHTAVVASVCILVTLHTSIIFLQVIIPH